MVKASKAATVDGKRTAVAYIRVSTEMQAREGQSLEAQEAKLKAWADANGYSLIAVLKDEGLSAKRMDNRPGLNQALDLACRNKAVLVAYSLSRLARSTRDAIAIAERLQQAGAELASLSERIDTSTASGRAFFGFMAVLAQFEREQTAERVSLVLAHRKANGKRSAGSMPYGYELGTDGESLVPVPQEQDGLALMRRLRSEGASLRTIGARLTSEGYRPKGGGVWHPKVIRSLVK